MVNVDRDLPKLLNAPLGFDLAHAESICSRCCGAVSVARPQKCRPCILKSNIPEVEVYSG